MPFGVKPACARCKSNQSTIWKKTGEGEVLCNACVGKKTNGAAVDGKSDSENSKSSSRSNTTPTVACSVNSGPVRKSARLKPTKYRGQYNPKALATKGKSRRVIFKKNPIKAPDSVATIVTQELIYHDGHYWQAGDIVSVVDEEDGCVYYAQVRGFLQDQYCEKSAVIAWLLPTSDSPAHGFHPASYILGPEEELPRPMSVFQFVCHAPCDYFKCRRAPYPTTTTPSSTLTPSPAPAPAPALAFITPSRGGVASIRPLPDRAEIFGLTDGGGGGEGRTVGARQAGRGKGRGHTGHGAGARKAGAKGEKTQHQQPEIKVEVKEETL